MKRAENIQAKKETITTEYVWDETGTENIQAKKGNITIEYVWDETGAENNQAKKEKITGGGGHWIIEDIVICIFMVTKWTSCDGRSCRKLSEVANSVKSLAC